MDRLAFMYTLDAIFATMLIVSATLLLGQLQVAGQPELQTQYASQDAVQSLNAIQLHEHPEQWVRNLSNQSGLTDNDTLLYAAGYLWTVNDSQSQDLLELINDSIPQRFGLRIDIEDEQMLLRQGPEKRRVSASVQQITGIDEGKPAAGTSSSAYLRNIRDKRTSSFALFGGFFGQGNITHQFSVPEDVNASRVSRLELELDTPQQFELYLNGDHCGTFTPQTQNMTPDRWDVTGCNQSIQPGVNDIGLRYDDLQDAYASGGFFKASYTTDELVTSNDTRTTTYDFPRIDGVVNLYDAFVVPQTLRNLTVQLHYTSPDNDSVTYLTIGEKTVYEASAQGEFNLTLTDDNLSILDYEYLSNKTVPIRFASYNATSVPVSSGDADVVLVTDYSGSMKKSIADWSQGNSGDVEDCENSVYTDDSIRRTHLARCLDKEVVDMIIEPNETGNRLWPVHYVDDDLRRYDNPRDREALMSYYETTTNFFPNQGTGKTCVACALSEAYEVFEEHPEDNRSRFVILMSDGLPTHCTEAGCNSRSTEYGTQICEGLCDVNGQNCNEFGNMCTDGSCNDAISNAQQVAQDLRDDYNVTIHTVGYGPVGTCSKATQMLQDIADATNGTYSASNDTQQLKDIYRNISQTILDAVEFESQTAIVPQGVAASTLHGDSFIRARHDPISDDAGQQEIELTRQSDQFGGCTGSVDFPEDMEVQEAVVTSYSGNHWTDWVGVNSQVVYNLSDFLVNYQRLGDPYRVNIPPSSLGESNTITVNTGDSPDNATGCSQNNSLIYTARVPGASASTPVLEHANGCEWTIENDDETTQNVTVPSTYNGSQTCSYTNAQQSYNETDAMQVAVYRLLEKLDFDEDGRIFVSLEAEDLEIILTKVDSVPYLWGPILVRAEVWQ